MMTLDGACFDSSGSFGNDESPTLIRRRPAEMERRRATALEVLAAVQWQYTGTGRGPDDHYDIDMRGPGLGLSFFCLEPETKALLARFCELREALYYR